MMFGEKKEEYDSVSRTKLPVFQMPKYITGREAAVKLLDEKDYMSEADFWILMNRTKAGDKMLYSGLIISHNGCLKINDNLPDEQKFRPECVSVNESGYGGALVFTYVCPEQRIYEVGEVTSKNCKNEYPYAMALKRCFDRVVLKQCKLAYYGVYSDSEADEFNEGFSPDKVNPPKAATPEQVKMIAELCFETGTQEKIIFQTYKKNSLDALEFGQAEQAIRRLKNRAEAV